MPRESEDTTSINVELILPECIDKVASFIPVLASIPAKEFARWPEQKKRDDGVLELSLEPHYHPAIGALMRSFYENHFVQPFDWAQWQPTGAKICEEPNLLSRATLETCIKLITLHIRKDRFVGGHFGAMVSCGHIPAILHRLVELRKSLAVRTQRQG
jgi:hypothetical protein